jgi:hypothetical protein
LTPEINCLKRRELLARTKFNHRDVVELSDQLKSLTKLCKKLNINIDNLYVNENKLG